MGADHLIGKSDVPFVLLSAFLLTFGGGIAWGPGGVLFGFGLFLAFGFVANEISKLNKDKA